MPMAFVSSLTGVEVECVDHPTGGPHALSSNKYGLLGLFSPGVGR